MKFLPLILFLIPTLLSAQSDLLKNGDEGLRVQILLDQECFGPGFLDGKPGNFTRRAAYAYNRHKGRVPGDWESLIKDAKAEVSDLYAVASVPSFASKYINSKLPTSLEKVGDAKIMAYRSYLEFMAERYHTSESFLLELNGKKVCYGLRTGSTLKVPNIKPFLIEKLAVGRSHKETPKLGNRTVVIDTENRQLFIYDPSQKAVTPPSSGVVVILEDEEEPLGKLVAAFPITPGQEKFIHRGTWKVLNCVEFPTWRYDKQLLKTGKRGKEAVQVAHGPNNPVGVMWSGLSKSGIGIHGTSSPRTIGRSRSAGCYRLANWDAARFPEYVRPGSRVIVR